MFSKKYVLFVGILVLSSLLSFSAFAEQAKTNVEQFYPAEEMAAHPEASVDAQVNVMKESVKKRDLFTSLIAYKAVRENDITICKQSGDPAECESKAKSLLAMRNIAERNCDKIENKDLKEICYKLRDNNCSALKGWQADMCEGLSKGDTSLVENAINSSAFIAQSGKSTKEDNGERINCFYGFKYYNSVACEKVKLLAPYKYMGRIIFAADADDALDKIAKDVALFQLSKQKKDAKICDSISDSDARKRCLDPSVTNIW